MKHMKSASQNKTFPYNKLSEISNEFHFRLFLATTELGDDCQLEQEVYARRL